MHENIMLDALALAKRTPRRRVALCFDVLLTVRFRHPAGLIIACCVVTPLEISAKQKYRVTSVCFRQSVSRIYKLMAKGGRS